MISRRSLFGAAAGAVAVAGLGAGYLATGGSVASLSPVPQAVAGEMRDFDAAAFAAAQAEGRPILVDIRADWCIVCARQAPIISSLAAEPRFADLIVFEVDFDTQKSIVRDFGAFRQATLIAYRGEVEVGRSVYESRADAIEALLEQTL